MNLLGMIVYFALGVVFGVYYIFFGNWFDVAAAIIAFLLTRVYATAFDKQLENLKIK